MAPFNLSELAVREIKLPKSSLGPQLSKSFHGRFLAGLFIDFWTVFTLNFVVSSFFQSSVKMFLTTRSLHKVWSLTDLTMLNTVSWSSVALIYFFTSYYLNHGQTAGMHFTKCRIALKSHDAQGAFRWSMMSLSLYLTMGLSSLFIKKMSEKISAHDHLWLELLEQKEMAAPDVRTLTPVEVIEQNFAEAA